MSEIKKVIHAQIETTKDLIETIGAFLTIATPYEIALFDGYISGIVEARTKDQASKPTEKEHDSA